MNISMDAGFTSKLEANSSQSNSISHQDLPHFISEYQNAQNEPISIRENESIQTQDLKQDQILYATVKNQKLPVRMFKDRMDLLKQNRSKKDVVRNLQIKNTQLKQQYNLCLMNNQKIEQFLKEIEFTFKNDSSNQRASDILLRAKKNLHRQQKDSQNNIDRLMKKPKVNEVRQLKMYLKVLREQKTRLQEIYINEARQNQILRKKEDFNQNQRDQFDSCQKLVTQILNTALVRVDNIRKTDEQEKLIISTNINHKKIQDLTDQSQNIDQIIKQQLLKQQGLQYQIEILKSKLQQKNKRHLKQENQILKKQIIGKKKRMSALKQELQQKMKTQEYITKWTKQLKIKIDLLKEDHFKVRQQFEEEINKLSRQIQDWNRKYKAQLVQQQFIQRKSVPKENQKISQSSHQQRKIRVVKIDQIQHFRKKLIFVTLKFNISVFDFIRINILYRKEGNISLKQIFDRLKKLKVFHEEQPDQIFKLARYIVEDNGSQFSKIDMNQKISVSLAFIILKNFLNCSLTIENFQQTNRQIIQYLKNNFDTLKNEIWLCSGKTKNFTADTLKIALGKYIKEEQKVERFVEMIEFFIWKHFKSTLFFELLEFELMCEKILGRKLVKDPKKRISKMTIRSIFNNMYENHEDNIKEN